jgi:hypothetical protein
VPIKNPGAHSPGLSQAACHDEVRALRKSDQVELRQQQGALSLLGSGFFFVAKDQCQISAIRHSPRLDPHQGHLRIGRVGIAQERAAITELSILQYLVPVLAALVSPPWHCFGTGVRSRALVSQ